MTSNDAVISSEFATEAASPLKPYSFVEFVVRLVLTVVVFGGVGLLIGLYVPRSSLVDPQGQDLQTLTGP